MYSGLPSLRSYSRSHELVARRLPEDVRQRLDELGAIERLELDPVRAVQAVELGQQRTQRMAAVELVGPVAEHQHHALAAQAADEEVDERARRAVGPVEVLEHEDHGPLLAEQVEQLEQALEQPHLCRGIVRVRGVAPVVESGKQCGQLGTTSAAERVERRMPGADQRPERTDQWGVGKLAVGFLDGFAAEHERIALALERRSNSRIRRVLPTPDSPLSRTATGDPPSASRSARSSSWSSPVRPTK